ncbi:hypothetical protein F5X96DRAFT_680723 [Biscogniauxia mediterranea]|nr:hypothetical protein F5X96DRAFT_680723 [Biscogniauxia mediterranea]
MKLFLLLVASEALTVTLADNAYSYTPLSINGRTIPSTIVYELIYRDVSTASYCTPTGPADTLCDVTTVTITDTSTCTTLQASAETSSVDSSTISTTLLTTVIVGGGENSETITLTRPPDVTSGTVTVSSSSTTSGVTSTSDDGGVPSTGVPPGSSQDTSCSSSTELSSTDSGSLPASSQTDTSTVSSSSSFTNSTSTSDISVSQTITIGTIVTSVTTTHSSSSLLDFITTISISDIGLSTISLSPGETTIIPLPAGLLTTLSGPATASETVIPLPSGQQTTITFNFSITTLTVPSPTASIGSRSSSSSSIDISTFTDTSTTNSLITSSIMPPSDSSVLSSEPGAHSSSTPSIVATSSSDVTASTTNVPLSQSSTIPASTVRVFFDNTSYLVPTCQADPLLILLSDGFRAGFLYCDKLVTENGWTVRWAPRGIRNDLSPASAAGTISSGDDGYGGLFGLFGKLGGDILNIGYDAATGLVDMGDAYEMRAMNDIHLGDGVSNAIESLRASSPDIMPRDLETINQLGSGITQAENHWQQFLNLADVSGATAAGLLPIVAPMAAGIWGLNLAIRHRTRLSNLLRPGWPADTPDDKRPEQPDSNFYYIHCKKGTTVTHNWSPKIPPAYFASLNLSNAEMIKYIPIVDYILKQPTYSDTLDPLYDQGPDIKPMFSKSNLSNADDAYSHKESPIPGSDISSPGLKDHNPYLSKSAHPPNKSNKRDAPKRTDPSIQPYLSDDSSGKGSWIFILDAGFNVQNVNHELNSGEAHPARREIRTYLDGNQVSIGHGTANSNLYLIKWKNMLTKDGRYVEERLKVPALKRGFDKILDAVLHEDIPAPRSVVLITYDEFVGDYLARFNWGRSVGAYLGDLWPQKLGRAENSLITVGGTNHRGSLFVHTSPEGNSGQGANLPRGSMTVYAMGKEVMTYNAHGDPSVKAGTSFAAPAVAGLVAYYLTLYSDTDMFTWHPNDENTGDTVGMRMKNYLVEKSFSRVEADLRVDQTEIYPPYPLPDYINAAYNMARGDQCPPGDNTPGDKDYCPASSSTSSFTSSTSRTSPGAVNADYAKAHFTSAVSSSSESLTRLSAVSKTRDVTTMATASATPGPPYTQTTPSTLQTVVTLGSTHE